MTESILTQKGIKLDIKKYWSIVDNVILQKNSWIKDKIRERSQITTPKKSRNKFLWIRKRLLRQI